jgi:DNA topoisomerase-1
MPPKFYKKKSYYKPAAAGKTTKAGGFAAPESNATYLIIVESPSKCKKIEEYLGSDYKCIASKGHFRFIHGLKSIDTKHTFEPVFSLIEEKRSHVESMRTTIRNFRQENIILATDDDREGEAIAWHICQVFDLPVLTTKRILFHEITRDAILHAVETPTTINMNLVKAQHARQVLDIIVGYKISPFLWKFVQHQDTNAEGKSRRKSTNALSAGRCQTPALRLVYDNEINRQNAVLEKRYKTVGIFFNKNMRFTLNHEFAEENQVAAFLRESRTCAKFDHILNIGEAKAATKSPPKPFNTSRLLQSANSILHINPKETMRICQQLYQEGHITYMRTESTEYSAKFIEQARAFIAGEFRHDATTYVGHHLDKITVKNASNPHEAIRITNICTRFVENSDRRITTMYQLIWRNTIQSCMSEAKYKTHEITISAPLNHYYSYVLEIPVFLGWQIVDKKTTDEHDETGTLFFLQSMTKNTIHPKCVECCVVIKNQPSYYCESSLIKKLEDLGIGRPSTFATIVDTIQERGYVTRKNVEGSIIECKEFVLTDDKIDTVVKDRVFGNEKNRLVIQPTGVQTIEFLTRYFDKLFSYDYTKQMEERLDEVTYGSEWAEICKRCYSEIKEYSKPVSSLTKQTFQLDAEHVFVFHMNGPVIKKISAETDDDDGDDCDDPPAKKATYISVKKNIEIDVEKLKRSEYTLADLAEIEHDCLGTHEDQNVYIKTGRYGAYIEYGDRKISIKTVKKPLSEITLEDVVGFLLPENSPERAATAGTKILRVLSPTMSIRGGKFGPYVFYKRADMKKPEFLNIKKFKDGYFDCDAAVLVDWLHKTYKLPIGFD